MLDLGATGELLFIAFMILLLVKPKDLPKIMRKLGRLVFTIQQAFQYYKYEWTTYCSLLDQDEFKETVKKTKNAQKRRPPKA